MTTLAEGSSASPDKLTNTEKQQEDCNKFSFIWPKTQMHTQKDKHQFPALNLHEIFEFLITTDGLLNKKTITSRHLNYLIAPMCCCLAHWEILHDQIQARNLKSKKSISFPLYDVLSLYHVILSCKSCVVAN